MKRAIFVFLTLLIGISAQADRLDHMISPMSNFVNNEDPRIQSEARFHYAHHDIHEDFLTGGGDVNAYALQLRYAVDERLAIIATKDGYIDFNPKAGVPKDEGWADLEAGVKYAFHYNPSEGSIGTVALRYLIPTGDEEVFQGQGDGMLHPSVHGAWAFGENINLMAGSGIRIPMDSKDSTFWDFDFHADYRIPTDSGDFFPLVELNLINVVDGGKRLPIADEGQDLFNFGSSAADGESIFTGTTGLRYRPVDDIDIGVAYQFPISSSDGNHIINYRWFADLIFRF
ncbi:MAG: hypothetical protein KDD55_08840 [Bdellovibrionales bacterium]|nr:hypothetical protein [Bdellovibrionales bacterium]